ncbi:MAG: hypothetical protein FWE88_03030 [Phycisphaerae bacterium]|nr:hypothetical protein [Phycisphaerae bacterium]
MDNQLNDIVSRAVGQRYDEWATQHPSLASVIDHVELSQQTAERLRETPAYWQAVNEYHTSRNELNFLTRLLDLAGPVLRDILAK